MKKRRNKRSVLIAGAIIGLIGLMYFGLLFRDTEPDYYQPARSALITAKQRIEESFAEESDLFKRLHETRGDLEAAISALDQSDIDPEYRLDVENLRAQLHALADVNQLEESSAKQLQKSYMAIESQLNELIEKLERPRSNR